MFHCLEKTFAAVAALGFALFLAVSPASAGEVPMWEGIAKTQSQMDADATFIEKVTKSYSGDKVQAARDLITYAFRYVDAKQPDLAIMRLNQAWLMNPSEPGIAWGYAVALNMRGDPADQVDRFLAIAEKGFPNNARLLADYGRILDERGKYAESRTKFEKALDIDPTLQPAIVGMVRVATFLRDNETAEKYRAMLKQ